MDNAIDIYYNLYVSQLIFETPDDECGEDMCIYAESEDDAKQQALDYLHEIEFTDQEIKEALGALNISLTKIIREDIPLF